MRYLKQLREYLLDLRQIYRGRRKIYVSYKGKAIGLKEVQRRINQSHASCNKTVNIKYRTHAKKNDIPEQLYSIWLFAEYCRLLRKLI